MAINWYPHHLGDYAKKTQHLTILEHGAYRLLLDYFYSNGGPFPDNKKDIYRSLRAFNKAERRAIESVLGEFFSQETGSGQSLYWNHARAQEEISKYNEISEIKRKAANKRHAHASAHAGAHAMPPTTTATTTTFNKKGNGHEKTTGTKEGNRIAEKYLHDGLPLDAE